LGFVLGLFGTLSVDWLRRRRSVKEFRKGVQTELKQLLAIVNLYTIALDSKLNADKIDSFQTLSKEFDLYNILFPLDVDSTIAKDNIDRAFTKKDVSKLLILWEKKREERKQGNTQQRFGKLKYTFIQNNIQSISRLPEKESALLLNILRRLEGVNEVATCLDFCWQKSYDANIAPEDRSRLITVYQGQCQCISDYSHEIAKEIAHFLRQTAT
jgi:hypothetical protein